MLSRFIEAQILPNTDICGHQAFLEQYKQANEEPFNEDARGEGGCGLKRSEDAELPHDGAVLTMRRIRRTASSLHCSSRRHSRFFAT